MCIPQKPGQVTRKKRSISSYWVTSYLILQVFTMNNRARAHQKRWPPEGQDAEVVATWSFSSISRRFKSSKASASFRKVRGHVVTSFGIFFSIFRGPRVSVTPEQQMDQGLSLPLGNELRSWGKYPWRSFGIIAGRFREWFDTQYDPTKIACRPQCPQPCQTGIVSIVGQPK